VTNEIRHAYSVLGLAPGVSAPVIRQRYRVLLKELHLEAKPADRQREVLNAYRTIRRHYRQIRKRVSQSQSLPTEQRPLTREHNEAFTDGIGTENLLEPFLWPFRWFTDLLGLVGMVGVILNVSGLAALLVYALLSHQLGLFFRNEEVMVVAVSFLAVGVCMVFKRMRTGISR